MCMQRIVLDIAIGSLCLGYIICQCCYEVPVYKWFIIHTFILNALLECVLLAYTHCTHFKLSKMFYLSQLFINSMFGFLLQELQYIYYIISHAVSTPKNNF